MRRQSVTSMIEPRGRFYIILTNSGWQVATCNTLSQTPAGFRQSCFRQSRRSPRAVLTHIVVLPADHAPAGWGWV